MRASPGEGLSNVPWETRQLPEAYDVLAPDTSAIRVLAQGRGGSMVHCTLRPGVAVTLSLGTEFQFRLIGDAPLEFVCCTMPPWPGEDEAVYVEGPWTRQA